MNISPPKLKPLAYIKEIHCLEEVYISSVVISSFQVNNSHGELVKQSPSTWQLALSKKSFKYLAEATLL